MANEVINYLLIKGKDISQIEKYAGDFGDDEIDFEKIIPLIEDESSNEERIDAWGVKWKPYESPLEDSTENYRVYSFVTPWEAPDKIIWKLQELHPNWFIQNFWIDILGDDLGIVYGNSKEFDGINGVCRYTLEGFSELLKDHLDYSFRNVLIEYCNTELVDLQELLDEGFIDPDRGNDTWVREDLVFYQKLKKMIESDWK